MSLAAPAAADVVSAGPTAVSVTVYRDDAIPDPAAAQWRGLGLGMITETRTVDLPAGETRLVLEGVADGAIPETAALEGLPGTIKEQNFDYDLLSPGSLIEHSVDRPMQLVRINPKTGKRTIEDAVLRSGPNGVVVDHGGQVEALGCSGGIEGLVFTGVPTELTGKAALSTTVWVNRPGRYKLQLAYLTVGLAWKSSYVARIGPDATTLDLTGWITLANHGATSFANAPTAVVAGRLERQAVQRIEAVLAQRRSACWPMGNSHHPKGEPYFVSNGEEDEFPENEPALPPPPAPMSMAMATTPLMMMKAGYAAPRATQSDLGDYKLYTLDEPTTVAARQTKQVLFLHQDAVKFDRVYVYRLAFDTSDGAAHDTGPTTTTLRLENKPENGLGRALPAGAVSIRQDQAGADRFLAQPALRDVPAGEPFELAVGEASDVQVAWRVTSRTAIKLNGRRGERATIEAVMTNAKGEPVTGEVRHPAGGDGFRVADETAPHTTKAGDPVWRLAVPANGSASVTYTVEYAD